MFERALSAFWILLGAAAAAYAWTLGLIGPSGPESGLFPFFAGLIIMGAGLVWHILHPPAPDRAGSAEPAELKGETQGGPVAAVQGS